MAHHDAVIADQNGTAFLADLNDLIQALITQHSGTADPATLVALQRFARTDLGVIKRRNAANSANILDDTLAETLVVAKSATFTAGLADFKRTFICTGTWSLNLDAAATLGDGWWMAVKNNGAGTITLDPNAAETIDGAATLALSAGQSCFVFCNGTSFYTVGILAITQAAADARYAGIAYQAIANNALAGGFYGATVTTGSCPTTPGTTNILNSSSQPKLLTVYGYGSAGTTTIYLDVDSTRHGRAQFVTGNSGAQLTCLIRPGSTASIILADSNCTALPYTLTGV